MAVLGFLVDGCKSLWWCFQCNESPCSAPLPSVLCSWFRPAVLCTFYRTHLVLGVFGWGWGETLSDAHSSFNRLAPLCTVPLSPVITHIYSKYRAFWHETNERGILPIVEQVPVGKSSCVVATTEQPLCAFARVVDVAQNCWCNSCECLMEIELKGNPSDRCEKILWQVFPAWAQPAPPLLIESVAHTLARNVPLVVKPAQSFRVRISAYVWSVRSAPPKRTPFPRSPNLLCRVCSQQGLFEFGHIWIERTLNRRGQVWFSCSKGANFPAWHGISALTFQRCQKVLINPTRLPARPLGLELCLARGGCTLHPTVPNGRYRWVPFPLGAAICLHKLMALVCRCRRTRRWSKRWTTRRWQRSSRSTSTPCRRSGPTRAFRSATTDGANINWQILPNSMCGVRCACSCARVLCGVCLSSVLLQ